MAKNGWLNLVGTVFSSFRLGFTGVRLKDVAGVLQIRNSADSADAALKASAIQLVTGAAAAKVLTSDASGNASWQDVPGAVDSVLPSYIMLDSLQQHLVAGSSLIVGISSSYQNNHAVVNSPGLDHDSWELKFVCAAGTYLLRLVGSTNINAPKLDVFLDGVLLINLDWYSNPAVFNVTKSLSTGAIGSGTHTLTFTVNGKNALSSGFALAMNYYLLN